MIRWLLQSTLCLILCPLVAAQQVAPPAAPAVAPQSVTPVSATAVSGRFPEFITVPKGTKIDLVLLDPLSSATNKRGDTIRLVVAEDVIVNGIVAIPVGTPVTGIVKAVKKMIPHQSSGQISFRPVSIDLAGHKSLPMSDDHLITDWGDGIGIIIALVIAAPITIALVIALLPIALPIIAVRHLVKKKSKAAGKNVKVTDDRIIPPCMHQTAYLKSATRLRVTELTAPSPVKVANPSNCVISSIPVTQNNWRVTQPYF